MRSVRLLIVILMAVAAFAHAVDPVSLWEFDNIADPLAATLGTDLELRGNPGSTAGAGSYTTMTGITVGDGAVSIGPGSHFRAEHGIAPNGGGSYVNEWTILVDFKYPTLGWISFFNTNQGNTNDGDCFVRGGGGVPGSIGLSATGYGTEATATETWYRLVVSVDNDDFYRIYLDGVLYHEGTVQAVDGRFSLDPVINLFADENGEDLEIHVSAAAMWDVPLTEEEAAGLGVAGDAIYSSNKASDPLPISGQTSVALNTNLTWTNPENYDASKFVLYFRAADPNWTETGTAVVDPVVDQAIDSDPNTTQATVPVTLTNLKTYFWRVDSYEPNLVAPYEPTVYEGSTWSFTTVTANAEIQTDPASQTVPAATTVQLTVAGLNITDYQWYKDGVVLDGTHPDIALYGGTETSSTLEFSASLTSEGYYYCEVDNALNVPAVSAEARVMVERMVARWTLDGTLAAVVGNPAENWDGDYLDPNEANPNPDDSLVSYVAGADGNPGTAVKFNGNNFVEIPDSSEFFNFHPQGLTLTAWLLGPSGGDYHRAVSKTGSYDIWQQNAGWIDAIVGVNGWRNAVTADEANEGKWRFVAITYDPETNEEVIYGIYDDDDVIDVLHSNTFSSSVPQTTDNHLRIGGRSPNSNTQYFYEGSIDDVRVYNYALTASDIQAIYAEMTSLPLCMNIENPAIAPYDYNKDCQVNLEDFTHFVSSWLECGLVPACN